MRKTVKFGRHETIVNVIMSPVPHVIRDGSNKVFHGWYKDKVVSPGKRPRPCTSEHFLLAPYRGYCPIDCKFCYLNLGRSVWAKEKLTIVDRNYPKWVASTIEKLRIAFPLYLSPYVDVFNPLEEKYRITMQIATIANYYNIPFQFTTKRVVPEEYIELLASNPYNYVHYSVFATDEDLSLLSPGASSNEDIYNSISELSERGIYVAVRIDPLIPSALSKSVEETITEIMLNSLQAGAKHFVLSFAEFSPLAKKSFMQYLSSNGRDASKFDAEFSSFQTGTFVIDWKRRKKMIEFAKSMLGVLNKKLNTKATFSLCFEFYKKGKQIVNANLEFSDSRSCHGKTVPIHYRDDGKFVPLKQCWGACLTCPNNLCGISRLQEARKNQLSDYKQMKIGG